MKEIKQIVTVGHLKVQTGLPYPRPVLLCRVCGETYSANRGDYFMLPLDYVFECCDEPMELAVRHETFEPVNAVELL